MAMNWMNSLKEFKTKALKLYTRNRGKSGMIYILKKDPVLILTAILHLRISNYLLEKLIKKYTLHII